MKLGGRRSLKAITVCIAFRFRQRYVSVLALRHHSGVCDGFYGNESDIGAFRPVQFSLLTL